MRQPRASFVLFLATTIHGIGAACTVDVCSMAYIQSALPANGFIDGVTLSPDSVTANSVKNYSVAASSETPAAQGLDFCNVTFSYGHAGLGDTVCLHV